jgi:hypothetical protein
MRINVWTTVNIRPSSQNTLTFSFAVDAAADVSLSPKSTINTHCIKGWALS